MAALRRGASRTSQVEPLRELDGADLLRGARERRFPVRELDEQFAARQVDGDRALAPAARYSRRRRRPRARPGREGLPRSALPDADGELVRPVDAHELDVRALGEALVRLHERPEPAHLGAVRLASDYGVRVADGDGRQLDALPPGVDRLRLPDLDLPQVELDLASAEPSGHFARSDADPHR